MRIGKENDPQKNSFLAKCTKNIIFLTVIFFIWKYFLKTGWFKDVSPQRKHDISHDADRPENGPEDIGDPPKSLRYQSPQELEEKIKLCYTRLFSLGACRCYSDARKVKKPLLIFGSCHIFFVWRIRESSIRQPPVIFNEKKMFFLEKGNNFTLFLQV